MKLPAAASRFHCPRSPRKRLCHQRRAELHARLHRLCGQMPGGTRGAEQRVLARPDHGLRPRTVPVECHAPARRRGSAYGRPHAAQCRFRLPAPGHGKWRPCRRCASLWIPQICGGADVLDQLRAEEGWAPPQIKPFSTAIFHCSGAGRARPSRCPCRRRHAGSRCDGAVTGDKGRANKGALTEGICFWPGQARIECSVVAPRAEC